MPADTKTLQWSARHVPLSVSVASNVPGYEPAQCYVTDGDSDKLVANMMDHLIAISDAAFGALVSLYADVLDELDTQKYAWEEVEAKAQKKGKEINPYEKLIQQLCSWLHQLPVIGFNSGHYDLNAIKKFFVPLLIRNSAAERASCFVIKRQNNFMCLTTDKESPGRRLVRADANCIPISRVFLARLPEVPRRPRGNEPEERQDHGDASGRHEKAHCLPSTARQSDRNVGVSMEART